MNEQLLKTKLVEYIETGDELLLDNKVLYELEAFIMYKCGGWKKKGYTAEEIKEICLCKIGCELGDYDPERGGITTFLAAICKYAMMKHHRDRCAKKRIDDKLILSMNDIYYRGNANKPITYEDVFFIYHDKEFTDIDYDKYIKNACHIIKETHNYGRKKKYNIEDMMYMYIDGHNQGEIGNKYNISQVQVSRILKKVREKIKELMERDNLL